MSGEEPPRRPCGEGPAEPDGFVDQNGRLGWEQYPTGPRPPEQFALRRATQGESVAAAASGPRLGAIGVLILVAAVVIGALAAIVGSTVMGWVGAAIALSGIAMIAVGYQRYRERS